MKKEHLEEFDAAVNAYIANDMDRVQAIALRLAALTGGVTDNLPPRQEVAFVSTMCLIRSAALLEMLGALQKEVRSLRAELIGGG